MKKHVLAACVAVFGCLLAAAADAPPLATLDTAKVKAVTLAAIREKYPDINPATLQYMGTTVAAAANDAISVHPRYLIVDAGSTNRPMSILVSLDAHGHVMSLSKAMTPSITLAPTMRRPDSTVTNAPKAYVNDIK